VSERAETRSGPTPAEVRVVIASTAFREIVMRKGLVGLIVIGTAIAAALTELILFRIVRPPDETSALLGGLWVALPYLATAGLALLLHRRPATLIVLLIGFLIAAGFGLSLLGNAATQQAIAEQNVKTAVLPGEGPNRGPAGMRKSGAEVGAAITGVFSILLLVVVPPAQLAVVVIPTAIGYGVSALARTRRMDEDEECEADP
jgi:hypothetical protein